MPKFYIPLICLLSCNPTVCNKLLGNWINQSKLSFSIIIATTSQKGPLLWLQTWLDSTLSFYHLKACVANSIFPLKQRIFHPLHPHFILLSPQLMISMLACLIKGCVFPNHSWLKKKKKEENAKNAAKKKKKPKLKRKEQPPLNSPKNR